MKSKIIIFVVVVVAFLSVSCANKSVLTSNASLTGYKYAIIDDSKDRGGDASLMNFKMQVQQAVHESFLEEVKTEDIETLTNEDKEHLIVLQLSGSQTHDNAVATINVIDYTTSRILGSCNGIFGLSFSTYGDMNGAIKKSVRAFKRMLKR